MDFNGVENLAALPVAVVLGYFMFLLSRNITNEVIKFASNHMEHNTQAINDLRGAIETLTEWLHTTASNKSRSNGT